MHALLGQAFDDLLAELAQRDAGARQLGIGFDQRRRCCGCAGSESMPSSRSGAERWKKLSACDCTNLRAVDQLAQQLRRRGGMRTAMMASQAFDDASRWLTGQMPQMRAVMAGIS